MTKSDTCLTGQCPPATIRKDLHSVKLSEGSGGREMQQLIAEITSRFPEAKNWQNIGDDGASFPVGGKRIVFTTDTYTVTPIFFPGGNIGTLAFCGTVNDLAVMGAEPLGLSLSFVLEEGFPKDDLFTITETIGGLSGEHAIPIVTGDTKVMEKGSLDKILINTSGIGICERVLDQPPAAGDSIIVSGGIGEHGAALLAKRFEMETILGTDSKPLHMEIRAISHLVKQARDITRGGLAASLNELAKKNGVQFVVTEQDVPIKKEVRALTEILGIDAYSLASEGRFICMCAQEDSGEVVSLLQPFNRTATVIGRVEQGSGVIAHTRFGKKILSMPSGNIVPRIC